MTCTQIPDLEKQRGHDTARSVSMTVAQQRTNTSFFPALPKRALGCGIRQNMDIETLSQNVVRTLWRRAKLLIQTKKKTEYDTAVEAYNAQTIFFGRQPALASRAGSA